MCVLLLFVVVAVVDIEEASCSVDDSEEETRCRSSENTEVVPSLIIMIRVITAWRVKYREHVFYILLQVRTHLPPSLASPGSSSMSCRMMVGGCWVELVSWGGTDGATLAMETLSSGRLLSKKENHCPQSAR